MGVIARPVHRNVYIFFTVHRRDNTDTPRNTAGGDARNGDIAEKTLRNYLCNRCEKKTDKNEHSEN